MPAFSGSNLVVVVCCQNLQQQWESWKQLQQWHWGFCWWDVPDTVFYLLRLSRFNITLCPVKWLFYGSAIPDRKKIPSTFRMHYKMSFCRISQLNNSIPLSPLSIPGSCFCVAEGGICTRPLLITCLWSQTLMPRATILFHQFNVLLSPQTE